MTDGPAPSRRPAPGPRRAAATRRAPRPSPGSTPGTGPAAGAAGRAEALAAAHREALDLACVAARAADEKKAERPAVLDVGDLIAITDAMVICSAPNTRLVATIAEEVERAVREAGGGSPSAVEGIEDANWVLLDFGAFIVHVFLEDLRAYYDLERLWNEAPRVDWRTGPAAPPG